MSQLPLQLRQYFFTKIEFNANPGYNPSGNTKGTRLNTKFVVNALDGQENVLAIELTVATDDETSENPPYSFTVSTFGILDIVPGTPNEAWGPIANVVGPQLLIGAIREEVAHITSRAPWGAFMVPLIALAASEPQPVTSQP